MTQIELNELHKKWINGEEGGVKANLEGAKLPDVKLIGADLRWVKFRCGHIL